MVEQEARQRPVAMQAEIKEARELLRFRFERMPSENRIQSSREIDGAFSYPFLQCWPLRLEMSQNRPHCRKRKGVTNESASKKRDADFGRGLVAIAPRAAIEGIHEFCLASEDAYRQPAADHLAVGRKIGADSRHG